MRYKSDYFAVWNDGKRYYKLGIGTSSNGVNYPETFQVSLMASNDNKEIDPLKLLTVTSKFVMPKKSFKDLYYPKHILAQNQEKHIQELNTQLNEFKCLSTLIVNAYLLLPSFNKVPFFIFDGGSIVPIIFILPIQV